MDFEMTMRLLFGDKAYHIASSGADPARRRNWLKKAVKKMLVQVDDLDTTVRHKERLMAELESVLKSLNRIKEPSWTLVYGLLRLSMRLLGYDYAKGAHCHTPSYWQTENQHLSTAICEGGDDDHDKNNAISVRRSVAGQLKGEGLSNFKIALVLNTKEYKIKNLLSELPPRR